MVKVITYGTYDMLHYGHIRLLERAKALGDYLIVGVTSDAFDVSRGKINVQQSLSERLKAVRDTGIADEIIVEEYEGQKIDDIKAYGIDIFTVGSDWVGKFDYLNAYCKVVYLDRTKGISSTEIRSKENTVRLGFIGDAGQAEFYKYWNEACLVNGAVIAGVFLEHPQDAAMQKKSTSASLLKEKTRFFNNLEELLDQCDAVYIASHPRDRFEKVEKALTCGKHVLCKSPVALTTVECEKLYNIANEKNLILMNAIKTAYSTAYNRLLLLTQSGRIGNVRSIDVTCTSLEDENQIEDSHRYWNSIDMWGPVAMLPVFQLLGTEYKDVRFIRSRDERNPEIDSFTSIQFLYQSAIATIKVGKGVKSEGELIISGTKGYIFVPAPWWKTDYFEIRYENPSNNRRYFYHLEGEGIRFELVAFLKRIHGIMRNNYIEDDVSHCISKTINQYYIGDKTITLV